MRVLTAPRLVAASVIEVIAVIDARDVVLEVREIGGLVGERADVEVQNVVGAAARDRAVRVEDAGGAARGSR